MANSKKSSSSRAAKPKNPSRMLWIGIGAAVVLFVVIAFIVSRGNKSPFEMTGGDTNPLVVLRNETTVYYQFEFKGGRPVELTRVIPRIQLFQDQVMTVDVQAIALRTADGDIPLKDGYFPEGESLALQPGDTFEIGVTYLGQELGWNRIYGFKLQYTQAGQSFESELELTDDYYVFVE